MKAKRSVVVQYKQKLTLGTHKVLIDTEDGEAVQPYEANLKLVSKYIAKGGHDYLNGYLNNREVCVKDNYQTNDRTVVYLEKHNSGKKND